MVQALCDKIQEYNKYLGIPLTLKEFGIDEEEFNNKIVQIAKNAVGDAYTGSIPRNITPEEMEKLFKATYYGDKVNF